MSDQLMCYSKWNPLDHGLDESFRLTNFTGLKGWGCKVPQNVLLKLLEGLGGAEPLQTNNFGGIGFGAQKIGEMSHRRYVAAAAQWVNKPCPEMRSCSRGVVSWCYWASGRGGKKIAHHFVVKWHFLNDFCVIINTDFLCFVFLRDRPTFLFLHRWQWYEPSLTLKSRDSVKTFDWASFPVHLGFFYLYLC